jgi:hypothetical protein
MMCYERKKPMNKIMLSLALLSILSIPASQPLQVAFVDTGVSLGYLPLPDGAGVSLAYQEADSGGYFSFVYIAPDGSMTSPARESSPYGRPERAWLGACGKYLHFVANWESGQIYRYRLELPEESGICQVHEVYFPWVAR